MHFLEIKPEVTVGGSEKYLLVERRRRDTRTFRNYCICSRPFLVLFLCDRPSRSATKNYLFIQRLPNRPKDDHLPSKSMVPSSPIQDEYLVRYQRSFRLMFLDVYALLSY